MVICCLDDHTRVVLQDTNGFLDSDYINANYMAVSNLQIHAFAAQISLEIYYSEVDACY